VAAIMLAQTADRKVSLVTPSLQVGLKLETQNLTEFLRRAYAAGLTMKALYQPTAFEGGYVHMRNPIGGQAWREGPFDSIVLGEPGRPNAGLAEQFNEDPFPIHVIGDAYAPRDVEAAILEGFETGRRM
jgi:hypothetical protein